MTRETRGWSAIVRPGAVPKLLVKGQVCTHPYAQAFLKEARSPKGEPETLCLTLCVLADTPRADLKEWTPVAFEKSLLNLAFDRVRIVGAGDSIAVEIAGTVPRRPAKIRD